MYGMLQTALRPYCMNRASVFEWHKRFKEARESVRDDEWCGRSNEVRTRELIGQTKNFMNKDRRVSKETISAQFNVSVGTVYTIIREEMKMRKICARFVTRVLREDLTERRFHDSREMVELFYSDPEVLGALVTCNKSWIYCSDLETKRQNPQRKHAGSPRLKKTRQSKSIHKFLMIPFFDSTDMIYMHWFLTGQTVNEEYYVEVLRSSGRDSVGRGQHSPNRVSGISTKTIHQSLSQTIWPRWASRQFFTLPIVQALFPVTFGYYQSSRKNLEVVDMRKLRRWKRLWRKSSTRSHKRTSMWPSTSFWNVTTSALQLEKIKSKGTRF